MSRVNPLHYITKQVMYSHTKDQVVYSEEDPSFLQNTSQNHSPIHQPSICSASNTVQILLNQMTKKALQKQAAIQLSISKLSSNRNKNHLQPSLFEDKQHQKHIQMLTVKLKKQPKLAEFEEEKSSLDCGHNFQMDEHYNYIQVPNIQNQKNIQKSSNQLSPIILKRLFSKEQISSQENQLKISQTFHQNIVHQPKQLKNTNKKTSRATFDLPFFLQESHNLNKNALLSNLNENVLLQKENQTIRLKTTLKNKDKMVSGCQTKRYEDDMKQKVIKSEGVRGSLNKKSKIYQNILCLYSTNKLLAMGKQK